MPGTAGTRKDVGPWDTGPSPDFADFTIGAVAELDVSSIGGYPVRLIRIVDAGAGTKILRVYTAGSGVTGRDLTVESGDDIGPGQITSIRGTTDTTTVVKVRVYK